MHIEPTGETFAARYAAGEAQVVWTTLVADLETPVSAFLKVAGSRPMSFLLESVEGGVYRRAIECDAGGNAHSFDPRLGAALGRNAMNRPIVSAGNKEISFAVER